MVGMVLSASGGREPKERKGISQTGRERARVRAGPEGSTDKVMLASDGQEGRGGRGRE